MFCQCGLECTLEGWVILPVKSHWLMCISAIFCRTAKSFGWPLNNFFRSSLNLQCLIAAEQHAYCSGDKIKFWSHLSEERPENPQKVCRNPSRRRIEPIKSAGRRCQKVILTTCPRHFLEILISCRIYIPEDPILQVNPLETSFQLLLLLLVSYFCPVLGSGQMPRTGDSALLGGHYKVLV